MLLNLGHCMRVWQAFEKFLYKQVGVKNKVVDTMNIGIFRKTPGDDYLIQYLPLPEYIKAGKFKLQNTLKSLKK